MKSGSSPKTSNDNVQHVVSGRVFYTNSTILRHEVSVGKPDDEVDSSCVSSKVVKFMRPVSQTHQKQISAASFASSSPASSTFDNQQGAFSRLSCESRSQHYVPSTRNFSVPHMEPNVEAIDTNYRSTSSFSRYSNNNIFRSLSLASTTDTVRRCKSQIENIEAASIKLGLEPPRMRDKDNISDSAYFVRLRRPEGLTKPIIQYVPVGTVSDTRVILEGEHLQSYPMSTSQEECRRTSLNRSSSEPKGAYSFIDDRVLRNSPSVKPSESFKDTKSKTRKSIELTIECRSSLPRYSVTNDSVSQNTKSPSPTVGTHNWHPDMDPDKSIQSFSSYHSVDISQAKKSSPTISLHESIISTHSVVREQTQQIIGTQEARGSRTPESIGSRNAESRGSRTPESRESRAPESRGSRTPEIRESRTPESIGCRNAESRGSRTPESRESRTPDLCHSSSYTIPYPSELEAEEVSNTSQNNTINAQLSKGNVSEANVKAITDCAREFFSVVVVTNTKRCTNDSLDGSEVVVEDSTTHGASPLFQEMVRILRSWEGAAIMELFQCITTDHQISGEDPNRGRRSTATLPQLVLRELLHVETIKNVMGSNFHFYPSIKSITSRVRDFFNGHHITPSLPSGNSDLTVVPYLLNEVAKYTAFIRTFSKLNEKISLQAPWNLCDDFMPLRTPNEIGDDSEENSNMYEWSAVPIQGWNTDNRSKGCMKLEGPFRFEVYNCQRKKSPRESVYVNKEEINLEEDAIDELKCEYYNSCASFINGRSRFLASDKGNQSGSNETAKCLQLPSTKTVVILGFPHHCPLHILLSSLERDYGIPVFSVYRCGSSTHIHNMLSGMVFMTAGCNDSAVTRDNTDQSDNDKGTVISSVVRDNTDTHLERLIRNGSGNLAGIVAQGSVSIGVPSVFSTNINDNIKRANAPTRTFITCSVLRCCSSTASICVDELLSTVHHRAERQLLLPRVCHLELTMESIGDGSTAVLGHNTTAEESLGTCNANKDEDTRDNISYTVPKVTNAAFYANVTSKCRCAHMALLASDPSSVVMGALIGKDVSEAAAKCTSDIRATRMSRSKDKDTNNAEFDDIQEAEMVKLNEDVLLAQTVEQLDPLQFLMSLCQQFDKQIWKRYQNIEESRKEFAASEKVRRAAEIYKNQREMDEVKSETLVIDVVDVSLRRLFYDIDILERGNTILTSLLKANVLIEAELTKQETEQPDESSPCPVYCHENMVEKEEEEDDDEEEKETMEINNSGINFEETGCSSVTPDQSQSSPNARSSAFPRWPKSKPRDYFYPVLDDVPREKRISDSAANAITNTPKDKIKVVNANDTFYSPVDKIISGVSPKTMASSDARSSEFPRWPKSQPRDYSYPVLDDVPRGNKISDSSANAITTPVEEIIGLTPDNTDSSRTPATSATPASSSSNKSTPTDFTESAAHETCYKPPCVLADFFREGVKVIQDFQRQPTMSFFGNLSSSELLCDETADAEQSDNMSELNLFMFGKQCENMIETTLMQAVEAHINNFMQSIF